MQFLKKKYYCLDPLLYNAKIEFWLIHITIVKNHETYLQSEVITLFTFITRAPFSCTISLAIFLAQKSRTVHLSSGVMNWFLAFSHSVFSKDTTTARGAKESNFQFRVLLTIFFLWFYLLFSGKRMHSLAQSSKILALVQHSCRYRSDKFLIFITITRRGGLLYYDHSSDYS